MWFFIPTVRGFNSLGSNSWKKVQGADAMVYFVMPGEDLGLSCLRDAEESS